MYKIIVQIYRPAVNVSINIYLISNLKCINSTIFLPNSQKNGILTVLYL